MSSKFHFLFPFLDIACIVSETPSINAIPASVRGHNYAHNGERKRHPDTEGLS
jgi:hypothetical protein